MKIEGGIEVLRVRVEEARANTSHGLQSFSTHVEVVCITSDSSRAYMNDEEMTLRAALKRIPQTSLQKKNSLGTMPSHIQC